MPSSIAVAAASPALGVSVWVLAALIVAAFVAGWVDSVVGGGGLIQLPALVIALPADATTPEVLGTNKLSSVAGTLVATLTYLRKVRVPVAMVLPLVVAAFVGSAGGSSVARFIPKEFLTPVVLVAVVVVGAYTYAKPTMGRVHEERHTGWARTWRSALIGVVIGFYDGVLGPGTGSFFVIAIVAFLGFGFLQGTVAAKLANLTTNIASILVFGVHGEVLWIIGGCMAVANLAGGFIGARMAMRHGNEFIRTVFLVVISILAVRLAWDTVAQWL
ncbi:TSUP family transporter [Dietzia sp. ANT_WB102]|uniref:TSUP family transporter n=1 Tax=Dietzia sp. ANT_WB102 TaxID=2597345 RepID=UPI0011ED6FBB|nr:TSUP family transporter [Dietzia sp. ANT_WB102]KAA0917168.1 TSUP family transporter [Dietzia sp. ANT_WB102]